MAAKNDKTELQKQQDSLQKPLGIRRKMAWGLFIPIILAFLILPVLASKYPAMFGKTAENPLPVAKDTVKPVPSEMLMKDHPHTAMSLDTVWNPGPLDSVHQAWSGDCQACHTGNFSRVKDSSCETCHNNMGLHVSQAKLPETHFEQGRCASCHRDHKGIHSLSAQNAHYMGTECAACHSHIKDTAPKTKTLPVTDFTKEHPNFRVTLATGPNPDDLIRVRMKPGEALTENTTFKFPHDKHLKPEGIDGPDKKVVMKCSDCHVPANTPSGFEPITMEKDCQSCHKLNFEPALPDRQVPHGNVEAALSTLDEFYSYLALHPEERQNVNRLRAALKMRPGEKHPDRPILQSLKGTPRQQAALAANVLFEKTACVVCHTVDRVPGPGNTKTSGAYLPQFKIEPLPTTHAWMPNAIFSHKAHAFEKCDTCHAARKSDKASDVLMPPISTCRECHSGNEQVMNKVKSDCGVCHLYHMHKPVAKKENEVNASMIDSGLLANRSN